MKSSLRLSALLIASALTFILPLSAEQNGKAVIAQLKTHLIFATNGDIATAGDKAKALSKEQIAALQKSESLKFEHYRLMGGDEQPVFRSYENWAMPMKPSEAILLSYEVKGYTAEKGLQLDLELWQSRKKVMKCDAALEWEKKLYVLGPKWRGGRLIIEVQVLQSRTCATPVHEKTED